MDNRGVQLWLKHVLLNKVRVRYWDEERTKMRALTGAKSWRFIEEVADESYRQLGSADPFGAPDGILCNREETGFNVSNEQCQILDRLSKV